ncbi:hypothetical protein Droror1_Dr00017477 [Drosera rotundifolia]
MKPEFKAPRRQESESETRIEIRKLATKGVAGSAAAVGETYDTIALSSLHGVEAFAFSRLFSFDAVKSMKTLDESSSAAAANWTESASRDDLRSRIFRLRLPKRSATVVINKWVREGNRVEVSQLRDIMVFVIVVAFAVGEGSVAAALVPLHAAVDLEEKHVAVQISAREARHRARGREASSEYVKARRRDPVPGVLHRSTAISDQIATNNREPSSGPEVFY